MQAAAAQKHLYAQSIFISRLVATQSRLRIYCRTFWKNIHEDLLDSWGASAAANVIHAYGKLHATHAISEAAAAQQQQQQPVSSFDEGPTGSTTQASMHAAAEIPQEVESREGAALATETPEAENITPAASGLESENSGSFTGQVLSSTQGEVLPSSKVPSKVDEKLQKFQRTAFHKFSGKMNGYGIANCALSFSKQDMLSGDVLELVQQGVQRTAPELKPAQVAMTLWAFHMCGQRLGCAEGPIKEVLSKPQGLIDKLNPLSAMRMMRVMHAWGWKMDTVREMCMDLIRAKATRFTVSEASQALAMFAELQAPLEEAHKPLLELILNDCNRLITNGLDDAERGIEWAKQVHVHGGGQEQRDLVQAAAAAIGSARARQSELANQS